MTILDLLGDELQRLAAALEPHGVPVIIGGGYGLLLRQQHVEESEVPTLRPIPTARSTNDLDVFLTVELVADAEKMAAIRTVLDDRGFKVVDKAKYFQFDRPVEYAGAERKLKVDLLAPPPRPGNELRKKVKLKSSRVGPRDRGDDDPVIHARATPEAFIVSEHTLVLPLGEAGLEVLVPHPFSFLLLKLFAYRDQRENEEKEYGRYHAYDLYRIVAMMTAEDFQQAEALRDQYLDDEIVIEARRIVAELFGDDEAEGALAVLEHARAVADRTLTREDAGAFTNDLRELLPRPDSTQ
ncbi:hypothetical protein [Rubrivirga sp. IMCC43871]|uniref:hypothetical protein n=1 Tax=Rubrivirga sp. IMCC43871 TaxID=3391575 RepID=UPI0039902A0A